jgi:hypothetical protein
MIAESLVFESRLKESERLALIMIPGTDLCFALVPSMSAYVAPCEERRTIAGLKTLTVVANIMKVTGGGPTAVFNEALKRNIAGFEEFYARMAKKVPGADNANRFAMAVKGDLAYWLDKGHQEFKGVEFGKRSEVVDKKQEAEGFDEETDESSDFDADDYTKKKADYDFMGKELDELSRDYTRSVAELRSRIKTLSDSFQKKSIDLNTKRLALDKSIKEGAAKKQRFDAKARLVDIEEARKVLAAEEAKLRELLAKK